MSGHTVANLKSTSDMSELGSIFIKYQKFIECGSTIKKAEGDSHNGCVMHGYIIPIHFLLIKNQGNNGSFLKFHGTFASLSDTQMDRWIGNKGEAKKVQMLAPNRQLRWSFEKGSQVA